MFKSYFAVGSRDYLYLLLISGVKNILVSFAYPEPYLCEKILKQHKIKFMVDSGAFTAWTKGKQVNIDSYIAFLEKHRDIIDLEMITSLDVIGWGANRKPTPQEMEEGAKKGYENWQYLKSKGWLTIPVFHQGENFIWLEKYANEAPRIGISHNKDLDEIEVDRWLYESFFIMKKIGKIGITKTHAFGLTSPTLLTRYPYDTVDSATWALTSAFGTILTPYGRIIISEEQKNDLEHYDNLPLHHKIKIEEYIDSLGFSIELTKKKYKYRNLANIYYFLELERKINENPVVFSDHQQPLFDFLEMDKKRYLKQND